MRLLPGGHVLAEGQQGCCCQGHCSGEREDMGSRQGRAAPASGNGIGGQLCLSSKLPCGS